MADRSQFWQNVDATKPDKLARLSIRQLRDYQNYFLEVQGDYNPALPQHENTVASERLSLLRDEIGSRRGKRQPGASVTEKRHKQIIFWMKLAAAVAILGVLIPILTLYRTSSPTSPSPLTKLNAPTGEPSPHTPTPAVTQQLPALNRTEQLLSSPAVIQQQAPVDPISFISFLSGALDKKLTDIQREEFINAHDGRRVTWEGYVIGVKAEHLPLNSNRTFSLAFRPEAETSGPLQWQFAMAWFPDTAKPDLLTLHEDQHVMVSGILATGTDPGHPILNDARLEKIYP
jgi:hypothetical protein